MGGTRDGIEYIVYIIYLDCHLETFLSNILMLAGDTQPHCAQRATWHILAANHFGHVVFNTPWIELYFPGHAGICAGREEERLEHSRQAKREPTVLRLGDVTL